MSKRATTGGVVLMLSLATLAAWLGLTNKANAHCQVPCGIYDDPARIAQLREDTATIAKAIDAITATPEKHDANQINQTVRWINTKEQHAAHIITVVSEYFLTQKVKPVAKGDPGYEAYLQTLADHHAVMTAAMKTKQSADPATVTALTAAIDKLATYYPPKQAHADRPHASEHAHAHAGADRADRHTAAAHDHAPADSRDGTTRKAHGHDHDH